LKQWLQLSPGEISKLASECIIGKIGT